MDVIHIANDKRNLPSKIRQGQTCQKSRLHQPPVNIGHPGGDVLPKLELLGAFADFNRPNLACPVINVLEQVAVDGPQMSEIEFPGGIPSAMRCDASILSA